MMDGSRYYYLISKYIITGTTFAKSDTDIFAVYVHSLDVCVNVISSSAYTDTLSNIILELLLVLIAAPPPLDMR